MINWIHFGSSCGIIEVVSKDAEKNHEKPVRTISFLAKI
jgi:hypothetical protein